MTVETTGIGETFGDTGLIPESLKNLDSKVDFTGQTVRACLERARDGAYLSLDRLKAIQQELKLTDCARYAVSRAIDDIKEKGDTSLFHLGLLMRDYYIIVRGSSRENGVEFIDTIPKLRRAIDSGDLRKVKGIGYKEKRHNEIRARLANFDELVTQDK